MKNNVLKYYIVAFFLCSSFVAVAQPGANDTGGGLETPDAAPAPIDDYVWVLALLGVIFVILKFRDLLKNKMQE